MNELMSQENPWLVNTRMRHFSDVMERSKLGLVVVDFWAEWCAPCRMLGPVLEKLASEADGKFTLVKAETEQNSRCGEFSVGGIPAVFAVVDGQIVNRFEGAMPNLQSWNGWMVDSENRNPASGFRRRCWRPRSPCTLGRIMENARSG